MPGEFVLLALPDGRDIYVRPAAVAVIYDVPHEPNPAMPSMAVVCTSTTNIAVPYSAAQIMEILYAPENR